MILAKFSILLPNLKFSDAHKFVGFKIVGKRQTNAKMIMKTG